MTYSCKVKIYYLYYFYIYVIILQIHQIVSNERKILRFLIALDTNNITLESDFSIPLTPRYEGRRKNKGEGGGRASQERRSTFRGKAKWSAKLGYETRRSYFLWRVPLWLAKTGKKTLPLRSSAPLTILWIVRALSSLSLSLIYSRRNIIRTKPFFRGGNNGHDMIDRSRKEKGEGEFQIFRIEKISRRNVSTFVSREKMENVNGWKKRGKLFYIYIENQFDKSRPRDSYGKSTLLFAPTRSWNTRSPFQKYSHFVENWAKPLRKYIPYIRLAFNEISFPWIKF